MASRGLLELALAAANGVSALDDSSNASALLLLCVDAGARAGHNANSRRAAHVLWKLLKHKRISVWEAGGRTAAWDPRALLRVAAAAEPESAESSCVASADSTPRKARFTWSTHGETRTATVPTAVSSTADGSDGDGGLEKPSWTSLTVDGSIAGASWAGVPPTSAAV